MLLFEYPSLVKMTVGITEFTLPICNTQTQNKSTNNNKGKTAG